MRTLPNNAMKTMQAAALSAAISLGAFAQQAITLPQPATASANGAAEFHFASDGPKGPGWGRPDEIRRFYPHEQLPAFFTRTIQLQQAVPADTQLQWIFTGPHAGFTLELSANKVRLYQRYYDSAGLFSGQGNYPQKIVRDDERQFLGEARTITVTTDSHLSVTVLVNGVAVITQGCLFDVTRHQLMLSAPRTRHLVVDGVILKDAPVPATVTVREGERHQTMLGFGGSPSIPAYAALSDAGKAQYWKLVQQYNLLIHREYPAGTELKQDLSNYTNLSDAVPHYYGDNFPNGEMSSFEYSKHIQQLGGEVLYELWALPAWAQTDSSEPGKPARKVADPEKYATILVGYCKRALAETGHAPEIVGVQNEADEPTDVFAAMTTTLRHRLDEAGFKSTKIQMADASYLYVGIDRAKALRAYAEAWRDTDYVAAHQYDYQRFLANPDMYDERLRAMHVAADGKPFLATEICLNDAHYQEASYRLAFAMAQLYHKDLTEVDAEALMYCWLLLDVEQPSFGESRSLLVPDRTNGGLPVASSFQLRALGSFSRDIRKGMARVGVESSQPDLLVSGYKGGDEATLVLLNRSTHAMQATVAGASSHWTTLERTSTYLANQPEAYTGGVVTVAPGEIVTLTTLQPR